MTGAEHMKGPSDGPHCEKCGTPLGKGIRVLCRLCFAAMPQSLQREWKQTSSEKGRLAVIRKVRALLKLMKHEVAA
jgi:hypothetical protein